MAQRDYDTLILITDAFPYGAVTERTFIEPELNLLADSFRRVFIIPTCEKGPVPADLELPANVTVSRCWLDSPGCQHRWKALKYLFSPPLYKYATGGPRVSGLKMSARAMLMASSLKKFIRDNRLDLSRTLFYCFWFDLGALALVHINRTTPLRHLVCAHGHDIYTRRAFAFRRLSVSSASKIYAASPHGRDALRSDFPEAAEKISVRTLGSVAPSAPAAGHHSAADRVITFLSVARVVEGKRVDLCLDMMRALAVARPQTRIEWIHVGDGPLLADLSSRTTHDIPSNLRIELLGELSNADVHRLYQTRKIDWVMLLSVSEGGLPISLVEALSYGKPIVASDYGGLEEVISDDCGLIMPLDLTREEFVRSLLPYIESDFRYQSMAEAASLRWEEKFNAAATRRAFVNEILSIR